MLLGDELLYKAMTVARYIIEHENAADRMINNPRLQKLLYFIQAWFLLKDSRFCFDEEMEAWDSGPVVLSVYREYKIYAATPILSAFKTMSEMWGIEHNDVDVISEEDKEMIDGMLDCCANHSTQYLLEKISMHKPFYMARLRPLNNTIRNCSMKEYYSLDVNF